MKLVTKALLLRHVKGQVSIRSLQMKDKQTNSETDQDYF